MRQVPLLLLLTLALWLTPAATPVRAADTAKEALATLKRALRKGTEDERKAAVNDVGRLSGHLDRRQQKTAAIASPRKAA